MKDSVILGIVLGFIAGALVVTHNNKAQEIVEKGKKAIKQQVKKMTN